MSLNLIMKEVVAQCHSSVLNKDETKKEMIKIINCRSMPTMYRVIWLITIEVNVITIINLMHIIPHDDTTLIEI